MVPLSSFWWGCSHDKFIHCDCVPNTAIVLLDIALLKMIVNDKMVFVTP